jgi:acyl-coenzyme A thioesterase PaaI-like protein
MNLTIQTSITIKTIQTNSRENPTMTDKAVQDYYPDDIAVCYGCGKLNEHGYQLKTFWEGSETVCHFRPRPYHTAFPGYVYGGLIASLIDCHATGTAASAKSLQEGKSLGDGLLDRFVTASLHVDYVAPTPIDAILELRGRVKESKGRKLVISVTVSAEGKETARGEVVALQMPEDFLSKKE